MILASILKATQERISTLPPALPLAFPIVTKSLSQAIRSASSTHALIGELKFASPTRGPLRDPAQAEDLAANLVRGGCVALSVITEPDFFQGSAQILTRVRQTVAVPILRKDFIIDPRQVYETRKMGADAILLIARILGKELGTYVSLSRRMGLEPLVEVHSPEDVSRALQSGAELLGINNRDLKSMEVDLSTTTRLAPLCGDTIKISMSGIESSADIRRLRGSVQAFLIGTSLMTAEDPTAVLGGFLSA
jgi:indole-3-glycerol phosphate synthase